MIWREWNISAHHNATVHLQDGGYDTALVEYSEENYNTSICVVTIYTLDPFPNCTDAKFYVSAVNVVGESDDSVAACVIGQ